MREKSLMQRCFRYLLGFAIMTLGIAISIKSNLGVSPVSSIPYTITCVTGLEMGKATIVFHTVLVLLQVLIKGRNFQVKNLFQVLAGVLFGYLTTFGNWVMSFVVFPESILFRIVMMLISTVLIAIGLSLYVPANLMPLAAEGTILAISERYGFEFSNVKVCFDVTVVTISLIVCLLALHSAGSVGIGTVVSAFLVGIEMKWIKKITSKFSTFCIWKFFGSRGIIL